MSSAKAGSMVESFLYVRDVFRNVSRMLYAADPCVKQAGFVPYKWKAFGVNPDYNKPERWLPYHAVRQYRRRERVNLELLTIGAVLWDRYDDDFATPLAVASYMEITKTPDDVYWISTVSHVRSRSPADGSVCLIGKGNCGFDANKTERFEATVVGRIASVALPLESVQSTAILEKGLLAPLLGHVMSLSGTPAASPA